MTDKKQSWEQMLTEAEGDLCLENLIFRYVQGLELGDSHWREDMHLERFASGIENIQSVYERRSKTKKEYEEEEISRQNPGMDANQIYLMKKYGPKGNDFC